MGDDAPELRAARFGVVCHSNRLPPQVRMALERLMAVKTPKVIIATTTLGQGVNIGITSVIISQTLIGKNRWITARDFWNICGRAGRAFIDGEAKVLFAIDCTKPDLKVRQQKRQATKFGKYLTSSGCCLKSAFRLKVPPRFFLQEFVLVLPLLN